MWSPVRACACVMFVYLYSTISGLRNFIVVVIIFIEILFLLYLILNRLTATFRCQSPHIQPKQKHRNVYSENEQTMHPSTASPFFLSSSCHLFLAFLALCSNCVRSCIDINFVRFLFYFSPFRSLLISPTKHGICELQHLLEISWIVND